MGSVVPQVAGVCNVQVGTGQGGALEPLGYTRNGAEITLEPFMLDVPGDQNGGDDGPPVDIQELGEIGRVRLELTKWNADVAAKVQARLKDGVAGTKATPGTLIFADEKYFRLLLGTPTLPLNFPIGIPRNAIEVNKGTKFSTLVMEFECHAALDTGLLYDNDDT